MGFYCLASGADTDKKRKIWVSYATYSVFDSGGHMEKNSFLFPFCEDRSSVLDPRWVYGQNPFFVPLLCNKRGAQAVNFSA